LKKYSKMEKLTSLALLIVTLVVGTTYCERPSKYDGSYTLRVDYEKRRYGLWKWGDFDAPPNSVRKSSGVIKRDDDGKRYQETNKKGVVTQIQRKEEDGKIWTYDIDVAASTCKRHLLYESSTPNGYFKNPLSLPQGDQTSKKESNGKVIMEFSKHDYDLSGDYEDRWVVSWDKTRNSYLPISHRAIWSDQYEWDMESASVTDKKYTPVSQEWLEVPHFCNE